MFIFILSFFFISNIMFDLPLILGSSSKHRCGILQKHYGSDFTTISPNIDEKAVKTRTLDPSQTALAVSHAKADALIPRITTPSLLICSDQVVSYKGSIREKPESKQVAKEYLTSYFLNGIPAETHSAIVIVNTQTGKRVEGVDVARQWFNRMPEEVVDALVEKGEIMYCSGGFMVDDVWFLIFLSLIYKFIRN